jgi:myo-inositol 2-dehydrogenase/D-chiro-inositol 1-dehydrogenase
MGRPESACSKVIGFRMCASGFKAPLAWFLTATAAKCSRLVPNSYMWRRAIMANREAKVEPARVVSLVQEKDVPVQIGFMRRFDPGYAKAKARIVAGELGKLETFRALSRDTYPPPLNFLKSSGGLFLDMAVHDLDLARFLVGEVEEVQAWGAVLIDERFSQANDADTAVTLLRFKNGVLGVTETSRRSNWGYDIRTEVAGAIGKVVIEAPQKTPLLFAREFSSTYDHFENFPDRFEKAYQLQLQSFFKDLQAGNKPSPGPEDALESLRLAIAVTKSWKDGKAVKVSEIQ